jgi:hypothetical protein
MVTVDRTLLEAALSGYERQREDLEAKIAEIRRHLGTASAAPAVSVSASESGRKKRVISAAAKKRMAAAQKRRWAAYHKEHGEPAAKPAKKTRRVLSAAAKRNIAEATKKRWAEYRAAKAAS